MEDSVYQQLVQEQVSLETKTRDQAAELNQTLPGFSAQEILAISIAVDQKLGGFFSKRNTNRSGISSFCTIHRAVIEASGHVPQDVTVWLDGTLMPPLDWVQENYPAVTVTDQHRELAATIMDYFNGLMYKVFTRKLTEFEQRVLCFIEQKNITMMDNRNIAISASLPEIYRNNLLADAWAQEEKSLAGVAEEEGVPGEYREFCGEIRYVRNMGKSDSVLIAVRTDQDNIVKFFWSGFRKVTEVNITNLFVPGNRIRLCGTVQSQGKTQHGDAIHNMVTHVNVEEIFKPE